MIQIRVLPCPRCGLAKTRDGRPYWLERYPEHAPTPFRYRCMGCNPQLDPKIGALEIRHHEFYSLKPLTLEDMESTGLLPLFLRDYKMGVFTDEQATDLLVAGFRPEDLVSESELRASSAGASARPEPTGPSPGPAPGSSAESPSTGDSPG